MPQLLCCLQQQESADSQSTFQHHFNPFLSYHYNQMREHVPYQVALRLVGAVSDDDNKNLWYDVQMCMLCRYCQTTSTASLVIVDEGIHLRLSEVIAIYAFEKGKNRRLLQCQPNHNISLSLSFSVIFQGLNITENMRRQYLDRVQLMNDHCEEVMRHLIPECYHCKSLSKTRVMCPLCGCLSFCTNKRYKHDRSCFDLGFIYHVEPFSTKRTTKLLLDSEDMHSCVALR